jgi:hypothetical protein
MAASVRNLVMKIGNSEVRNAGAAVAIGAPQSNSRERQIIGISYFSTVKAASPDRRLNSQRFVIRRLSLGVLRDSAGDTFCSIIFVPVPKNSSRAFSHKPSGFVPVCFTSVFIITLHLAQDNFEMLSGFIQ